MIKTVTRYNTEWHWDINGESFAKVAPETIQIETDHIEEVSKDTINTGRQIETLKKGLIKTTTKVSFQRTEVLPCYVIRTISGYTCCLKEDPFEGVK